MNDMMSTSEIFDSLQKDLEKMNFEYQLMQEDTVQLISFQLPNSPWMSYCDVLHPDDALPNTYLINLMYLSQAVEVREDLMQFLFFLNNQLPGGAFSLRNNRVSLKLCVPLAQATPTWDSAFICACLAYFQGMLEIYMPIVLELGIGEIDLAQAKQKINLTD